MNLADYERTHGLPPGAEFRHRSTAEDEGFTPLPNAVLLDKHITPMARLCYAIIKSYAYGKRDASFPGQKAVAEQLGVTDRTVRNYLTELESAGLITTEQRGMGKTNIYWIEPISTLDRKGGSALTGNALPVMSGNQVPTNNTRVNNTIEEEDFAKQKSFAEPLPTPKPVVGESSELSQTTLLDNSGESSDLQRKVPTKESFQPRDDGVYFINTRRRDIYPHVYTPSEAALLIKSLPTGDGWGTATGRYLDLSWQVVPGPLPLQETKAPVEDGSPGPGISGKLYRVLGDNRFEGPYPPTGKAVKAGGAFACAPLPAGSVIVAAPGKPSKPGKTPLTPKVARVAAPPMPDDVGQAIAVLCYSAVAALAGNYARIRKAYNIMRVCCGDVTVEQVNGFRGWWYRQDWRGKAGQAPQPHQVSEFWATFREGNNGNTNRTNGRNGTGEAAGSASASAGGVLRGAGAPNGSGTSRKAPLPRAGDLALRGRSKL